jgi:superfamily II DNA helicase RecQ
MYVILTVVDGMRGENVTINYLVDVYRGSKQSKIVANRHDKLPGFGKASHLKRTEVERLFHFLVSKNVLKEVNTTNKMGFVNGYVTVI